MNHETIAAYIADGKAVLGIEFGSTRIKAVLIGDDHAPIASGDHTWENRLEDGIWTYHLDDVWAGVQDAFAKLQKDVQANYGVTLTNLAAFGVSGMMHGFLAFDENGRQLAQFRTWRNTMTAQAAEKLTDLLGFNIPQRWSIAHLVQAMMNGEAMVPQIHHLTTHFNSRPSARGDGKRYAISANLLFNPYKSAWLNNSATQFVEIILVIFHRIIV